MGICPVFQSRSFVVGKSDASAGIRNTTFLKKKSSMSQKNYDCMNRDVRIQSDRNLRGFSIL